MARDFLIRLQRDIPDLPYNDAIYNEALVAVESLAYTMCGRDLISFGLPKSHSRQYQH